MTNVRTNFKPEPPGHFIREWRMKRGYTLEQLAEMIGVTHGALSQLERGLVNYRQPMLEALADALACTPADLLRPPPVEGEAPPPEDDWMVRFFKDRSEEEVRRIRATMETAFPRKAG